MNSTNKINIFLSTLNFVLCFVGYQFVTTLLLPASSDIEGISRTVTVPYRVFALLVSLMVILMNFLRPTGVLPIALKAFFFYWLILIIRIIYDVFFRGDVHLTSSAEVWTYVFGICLPAAFSILKSFKYIDLNSGFWAIFALIVITLGLTLFSNQMMLAGTNEVNARQDANLALNTISFGHLGVTGIILAIFALIKKKLNLFQKGLAIILIILGTFCMLRAGSRGPILTLLIVLLFWLFSSGKNLAFIVSVMATLFTVSVIFIEKILSLMGNVSPIIEKRLKAAIFEGDSSDRGPLYSGAIDAFFDSPLIGKQFAIFYSDGSFIYSHNLILDALMALGIIGGGTLIYFLWAALKRSHHLIRKNNAHFWVGLVFVQVVSSGMTSSAFYFDQLLSVLFSFLFLYYRQIEISGRKKKQSGFKGLNYISFLSGRGITKKDLQGNLVTVDPT